MNTILAVFGMGGGEIVLIFAVILLLFGAKKLPELARGLGKGINEFKRASNDVTEEFHRAADESSTKKLPPEDESPAKKRPPEGSEPADLTPHPLDQSKPS